MDITIRILDSFTFKVPTSDTETYTIESAKLSPAVFADIFENGLKQKCGDSVAAKDKFPTVADKLNGVIATRDALYDGEWGRARQSGPESPERRALKLALAQLQTTDEFKPGKITKDKALREKLHNDAKTLAAMPEYLEAAKTQLALEATLGAIKLPSLPKA